MCDFLLGALKVLIGTLLSGSFIVYIFTLIEKKIRFRRIMLALYYFYLLHGSRMKYLIGIKGVSYGSFDLSGLRKAINNYLEMSDEKTERLKLVIQLYDAVYQTAFHINIRSEDRHLETDSKGSESYKRGVAFAKEKYSEYKLNMKSLLGKLPVRKRIKRELIKDFDAALAEDPVWENSIKKQNN